MKKVRVKEIYKGVNGKRETRSLDTFDRVFYYIIMIPYSIIICFLSENVAAFLGVNDTMAKLIISFVFLLIGIIELIITYMIDKRKKDHTKKDSKL